MADENEFHGFAFIKYPDKKEEYLQTSQIEGFHPSNQKDFVFGRLYVIRSTKWNAEGRVQRNNGYICRMRETLKECKESIKKERPKYPVLEDRDENYLSSLSEHERKKSVGKHLKPSQVEELKKKAAEKDLEFLLESASFTVPSLSTSESKQRGNRSLGQYSEKQPQTKKWCSTNNHVKPTEKKQGGKSLPSVFSLPNVKDFDNLMQNQEKSSHSGLDKQGEHSKSCTVVLIAGTRATTFTATSTLTQDFDFVTMQKKIEQLEREKIAREKKVAENSTVEKRLSSMETTLTGLVTRLGSVEDTLKSSLPELIPVI